MLQKKLYNGLVLLTTLLVLACAGNKDDGHAHHHEGEEEQLWKEMDEFHMIMAEAFHPYKDSSNLEPARTRALELITAAEKWASAELPAGVDTEAMKNRLDDLRSEAATLAESVKSADDNVIGEQLTRLHHTFHEIEEAWYGGH